MDEHIANFIIEIKTTLASIDTKVSGILDQVKNHENRILEMEKKLTICQTNCNQGGFDAETRKLLIKALMIALGIIGTLTGAGALLTKILGN